MTAKELTDAERRLIAALYASALIIPFFAAFLFGHVLAAAGYTWLRDAVDWILLVVIPAMVVGAIVLRPRVRAARDIILRPLPPLTYPVFRIWCRSDEIFAMFRRAEEVRRLTESFTDVTTQRVSRLKAQPWVTFALQELAVCAAVFGIVWWAVSQTPEGRVGVGIVGTILLSVVVKLVIWGRPALYARLAEFTSFVLVLMNAGLAHMCRLVLAGMRFTEGLLVEIAFRGPTPNPYNNFEEQAQTKPSVRAAVHRNCLSEPAVVSHIKRLLLAR